MNETLSQRTFARPFPEKASVAKNCAQRLARAAVDKDIVRQGCGRREQDDHG